MSRINSSNQLSRFLSLATALLLVWHSTTMTVAAQEVSAPMLKLKILKEEGAINDIRVGTLREPMVEVKDENDRPVGGALVVFRLPDHGAGGLFENGSKTLITHTDSQGKAVAMMRPNKITGKFNIQVDATFQGVTAQTAIIQSNIATAVASAKLLTILAIAGGAAAAGVVAASRSSGGSGGNTVVEQQRRVNLTIGQANVGSP